MGEAACELRDGAGEATGTLRRLRNLPFPTPPEVSGRYYVVLFAYFRGNGSKKKYFWSQHLRTNMVSYSVVFKTVNFRS